MVSPLVSCDWLKEQLEKKVPDLRVLDGKFPGHVRDRTLYAFCFRDALVYVFESKNFTL